MSDISTIRKPPLIHIGLPKAASTYIRRAYFSHMSNNVLVPRGELINKLLSDDFKAERYHQSISRHCNGSDRIIFSGENLSGNFWDDRIAATVAHNLHAAWPRASVLVILREQLDYIRSAYSFCLTKGYRLARFNKFILSKQAELLAKCNYAKLVSTYIDLFGSDNVKVLTFEQFRSDRDKFDAELRKFCQMEMKHAGMANRRNASIRNRRQLEMIRRVNSIIFPLIKLEKFAKRLVFGKHTRLMTPGQHFTIQDYIVTAICKCVRPDETELELPAQFLDQAESVIKNSNAQCSELTEIDLASYGYMI